MFLLTLAQDLLQLFVLLVAALLAPRFVEVLDGAAALVLGLMDLQSAGHSALFQLCALCTDDLLIMQLSLPYSLVKFVVTLAIEALDFLQGALLSFLCMQIAGMPDLGLLQFLLLDLPALLLLPGC